MAKEIGCFLPIVGFCLHFCLEDYRIVLKFRYFCYSLKIEICGQRCEDIPCASGCEDLPCASPL